MPGRVTFVFDKAGVVQAPVRVEIRFGKHVDEALAVVKTLRFSARDDLLDRVLGVAEQHLRHRLVEQRVVDAGVAGRARRAC